MANIRSLLILNKLETLLAIRTNKNAYTQISNTREDSFDGLLRQLFREQTSVSFGVCLAHDVVYCITSCCELVRKYLRVLYQIDIVG